MIITTMKEEHEGIKFMGVWGGFFLCFFCCTLCHTGSLFPDQGSNPCPLQRGCGVLTTGLPGKSQVNFFYYVKFELLWRLLDLKKSCNNNGS